MPLPIVGEPAPDFTLASTAGTPVTLSDLRGKKVLLAFFPLAFTSTCTAELCAMRDDWSAFQASDTVVLPVSVDSIPTLKEYQAKERLPVDLLSDWRREVCQAYGTFNPERYYSNRAYVLIDRDGIVRWAYQEEHNGLRRPNAEILAQLAAVA